MLTLEMCNLVKLGRLFTFEAPQRAAEAAGKLERDRKGAGSNKFGAAEHAERNQ